MRARRSTIVLTALLLFSCSIPTLAGEHTAKQMIKNLGDDPGTEKTAAVAMIEATAKIGGIEKATALVERLKDRFPQEELLEKLVASCADLGDFDCAYYQATRIEPFNWRMRAMSQIASAFAENGEISKSRAAFAYILQAIARDAPANYRDQLTIGILNSVAEFTFLDIGLNAARLVADPRKRAEGLFGLALSAGRGKQVDEAAAIYQEAKQSLASVELAEKDSWLATRAIAAAVAAGRNEDAELYETVAGASKEWAYGQITAMLYHIGHASEADTWAARIQTPARRTWLQSLLAETHIKSGNCGEALAKWKEIKSQSWSAATLLHLTEENNRRMCADTAIFADAAAASWQAFNSETPGALAIGFQIATAMAAAEPRPNSLWTGRTRWQCTADPIIYPGWWDQALNDLPTPSGLDSADGRRATAPTVVKLGRGSTSRYYLYYMGESIAWRTRILRVEISTSDLKKPRPGNIALEFSGPLEPNNRTYSTEYLRAGPYYGSVVEDLDVAGEPAKNPDGSFKPWFMYIATAGNNPGVAISTDGGLTFALPSDPGINPIFPFEVFPDPSADGKWRRQPLEAKSKMYDQSGSGSVDAIRGEDGKLRMFYTARMWNYLTLDDVGAKRGEIFHGDGNIPDHGIGYAESSDGLHWNRRTSTSLGVTSSSALGTGRIIDPRFRRGAPGELEYTLTRPMVFKDGVDAISGAARYRMLVSSHSSTYRVRSLHSTDLINWFWDLSPKGGLFGLGDKGRFDDQSTAYGDCLRESTQTGDRYVCWYTGNRFGHYSAGKTGIGVCTMAIKE